MRSDCVQFEFVGFDPEYEVRSFVSTVAENLYLSSPSDSTIKVAMELSKGAVQASCRIASHTGTFMAEAIGDNPIKAIKKVEEKISKQLDGWRRRRFLNKESYDKRVSQIKNESVTKENNFGRSNLLPKK